MPCWEILCSSLCIYRMIEQQAGAGCRGRQPLHICVDFFRRKIAGVLCGFYFMLWDRKSGAEFFTPTPLCFFDFYFLYEGILILFALYHQYWIAVKIRFHGFLIFVCILKYLICQLVSRFRQLLYGLFIHSRTDR